MRKLLTIIVVGLFFFSCSNNNEPETPTNYVEKLPQEFPEEVHRFQQADSIYFGHLGYQTVPLDGDIVLYDRQGQVILRVSPNGDIKQQVARLGRGPGEVQDILSLIKSAEEGILVYDQRNQKIIQFNDQLKYQGEFNVKPDEQNTITAAFPSDKEDEYVIELSSYAYYMDRSREPERYLAQFNMETNTYGKKIVLKDRLIAMSESRAGGRMVPYTPIDLVHYSPKSETLFLCDTETSRITEIKSDFDTLQTISVSLPSQELSPGERDSLKEDSGPGYEKSLEEKLPEVKTPVEEFKVDHLDRFWLRLNYRGTTQKWLVLDPEGEPLKIVHLPKGGMLTHISPDHLGVRLDDVTFGIFKPVE